MYRVIKATNLTTNLWKNVAYFWYFRYLGQTINSTAGIRLQDFTSVWSYVYSSSKVGTNAAIEYITENYAEFTAA